MNEQLIEDALRAALAAIDPMLWASTSPDRVTLANGVWLKRETVQRARNLIEQALLENFID